MKLMDRHYILSGFRTFCVFLLILGGISAASVWSQEQNIRILLVTGGHGYDKVELDRLFQAMPGAKTPSSLVIKSFITGPLREDQFHQKPHHRTGDGGEDVQHHLKKIGTYWSFMIRVDFP